MRYRIDITWHNISAPAGAVIQVKTGAILVTTGSKPPAVEDALFIRDVLNVTSDTVLHIRTGANNGEASEFVIQGMD